MGALPQAPRIVYLEPKIVSDTTEFGSFTDAGEYIPRTIVENDLGATTFADAIDGTIVEFEDDAGQLGVDLLLCNLH